MPHPRACMMSLSWLGAGKARLVINVVGHALVNAVVRAGIGLQAGTRGAMDEHVCVVEEGTRKKI